MARVRSGRDWRECPDEVAPTVLIVGGFLTSPPLYRPIARRLTARGAAHVLVANVWTPDWLLAIVRGLGPITTRAARSLLRASTVSATSDRSLGAPLLVVGHSAGGMVARILTATEAFEGRRFGGAERIGALVTLGTPHVVGLGGGLGDRLGKVAIAFADRVVPGARFTPRVRYVSVAGRGFPGHKFGVRRAWWTYRWYQALLSRPELQDIEGDGVVPVDSALLEGASKVVLDRMGHGIFSSRPWYGSDEALDQWWPAALDAWRSALRTRLEPDDVVAEIEVGSGG